MRRRGLQIGRTHRLTLYAAGLLLLLSGICWALIQHLDEEGKAGDNLVKLKQPLIAIHGLSAMVFVFLLGTLLFGHIRRSWHARKNTKNGLFFIVAVGLLTLSGYALYYLGNESWRNAASHFHLWLGIAAPLLLILHIWLGRKSVE